jgi:putative FmdB family regulatory protein
MPLYDYECGYCGHIAERIEQPDDQRSKRCPSCNLLGAKRIISCGNSAYLGNQDAPWLKSVREVVGTETREGRAFLRDPSRANYHAWMDRKGLRPLEPGERGGKPSSSGLDEQRMVRRLVERHRKRTTVSIRSAKQ